VPLVLVLVLMLISRSVIYTKGHWKKKKRTPTYICRTHPKSTHPPPFFFFPPDLFFIAFSGVSQQVEFKNTKKNEKNDVKMFYKKMRKFPFRFFLREREPLNGLILIEATYRNGIHGSH
jgi:arginine deiminase